MNDPYAITTIAGVVGLLLTTALGLHHGSGGHAGHGGHGGRAGRAAQPAPPAHSHLPHAPISPPPGLPTLSTPKPRPALWETLILLAAPRPILTVVSGTGIGGLLLEHTLHGAGLLSTAVIGGVALEALVARPLMRALLGFASTPQQPLSALIGTPARASGRFTRTRGTLSGLVDATLNGETRTLLATLEAGDAHSGVQQGDMLWITAVSTDARRVTVTRAPP